MALTDEEKKMAKSYADKGAEFMFVPTTELSNMIARGVPESVGINDAFKILLMQRKAIRLDTQMVRDYCDNVLDINNTWLLNQGHIKVVPPQFELKKR